MDNRFFEQPILNSAYEYPRQHWDSTPRDNPRNGLSKRAAKRSSSLPIPQPKKRKGAAKQSGFAFDEGKRLSDGKQQYYATSAVINELRYFIDQWRGLKNPSDWKVTPGTQRLLQHWRHHQFREVRRVFCQIEAVETAIWLTEVAPQMSKAGARFLDHLANANACKIGSRRPAPEWPSFHSRRIPPHVAVVGDKAR